MKGWKIESTMQKAFLAWFGIDEDEWMKEDE